MSEASPEPRRAPACPLCGQPNECAPARTGSFEEPCWCQAVKFDAAALERVPENQRGKACICRSCAQTAKLRQHMPA